MNIASFLQSLGSTSENTIVIGSGILDALGIRKSNDREIVVTQEFFDQLLKNPRFEKKERNGKTVLRCGLLEVLTQWCIVDKVWTFNTLCQDSVVIDNVRYITVEFLCNAKTAWLLNGEFRQKYKDDIILMNNYLDQHTHINKCCS